ncbi:MAG: polyisoprenoid-binding protein [Halobacteriovoraceae bacterium]|nr:polyisoprenoid-binding protein [Halobacteriovoraceae bacterium]
MKLIILMGIILSSELLATNYKIDHSHTKIEFEITRMKYSTTTGQFNKFDGTFDYDTKTQLLKNLVVNIDPSSIDTNETDRDKHLRSSDFFDVEKYKSAQYTAKDIKVPLGKESQIYGVLNLHGVKKEVPLKVIIQGPVTDPWGNSALIIKADGKIIRKDFNLNWNKALGGGLKDFLIGDEAMLRIRAEALQIQK